MIEKKDLVIAVLATFCLTATLFMILPTRSQYDPWIDANDDGVIDSTDLGMLGNGWGTFGDPTKNVTIAEYATVSNINYTVINAYYIYDLYIATEGYRQITIGFYNSGPSHIDVAFEWGIGGEWFTVESMDLPAYRSLYVRQVWGPILYLAFYNPNAVAYSLWVYYYLTT